MRNFLRCMLAILLVHLVWGGAWGATVQIKAQGTSDAMIGAKEKAFQDAKRRALEKYISGLKSQSEASRLLAIKKDLFEKIDDYVKEPSELANEERNGKVIVTIQAEIDVTSLNEVADQSFKKDLKKAKIKKKKIAFVFVAREIESVTSVKDHNINEALDKSENAVDESRDDAASGNAKTNAAKKSTSNRDSDSAASDDSSSTRDDSSKLAQKEKNDASGKSSRLANSSSNLGVKGSLKKRNAQSVDGNLEEDGSLAVEDTGEVDSGKRDIKYKRKLAAKGAVTLDNQEDIDAHVASTKESSGDEEFSDSGAASRNSEKSGKEERKEKLKQNRSLKAKNAQDSTVSDSSDYATNASEKNKSVLKSDNSKYAETKNTSIQHSEERTYRIIESGTIATLLSGIFKDGGLKIADSFDAGDLLLKLQKAKSVNQIRPADLKQAIAAAQAEETDYLCIGTLDVDREGIDKATGNSQRYVLVNANVYDLTKKKLEKAAAVGNLNFSGLGENPEVAKSNALDNAAREGATKLMGQIRKHMLEDDDDD